MAMTNRNERQKQIIDKALEIARKDGIKAVTRDGLAVACGISQGAINLNFGTMEALRIELMHEAVARKIIEIVAEGLGAKNPIASAAPSSLKKQAIVHLLAGTP
jgi:AcrR family transcriptional regulator